MTEILFCRICAARLAGCERPLAEKDGCCHTCRRDRLPVARVTLISVAKDGVRGFLWAVQPPGVKLWLSPLSQVDARTLPHGWEPTREAARATAMAAVPEGAFDWMGNGIAGQVADAYAAEKRQARLAKAAERNADTRGSNRVEYLWCWSYGRLRALRCRVLKRTAERVFFTLDKEEWQSEIYAGYLGGRVYVVKVADLERPAAEHPQEVPHAHHRTICKRLYTEANWQLQLREHHGEPAWTVRDCRREMQKHHPDKGGDPEVFRLWRSRYEAARAATP